MTNETPRSSLRLSLLLLSMAGLLASPAPAAASTSPDLCAELDAHGHPRHCQPAAPERGPWWDGELCCDGPRCRELPTTGCGPDEKVYCELAELAPDGTATCVYEVESYCATYGCAGDYDASAGGGEGYAMCCYGLDFCHMFAGPCGGDVVWCHDGVTNEDGTYSCFDGEVI